MENGDSDPADTTPLLRQTEAEYQELVLKAMVTVEGSVWVTMKYIEGLFEVTYPSQLFPYRDYYHSVDIFGETMSASNIFTGVVIDSLDQKVKQSRIPIVSNLVDRFFQNANITITVA